MTAADAPSRTTSFRRPSFLLRSPRKNVLMAEPGGSVVGAPSTGRDRGSLLGARREQVAVDLHQAREVVYVAVEVGDLDHRAGAHLCRQPLDVPPVAGGQRPVVVEVRQAITEPSEEDL